MISILAVNWWSNEFTALLINSVVNNTVGDYEILICDNSGELDQRNLDILFGDNIIRIIKSNQNLGHGAGLDLLMREAKGDYILALDIDSHILLKGWDKKIVEYYESKNDLDIVKSLKMLGGEGSNLKPVRPCVMFFERDFFINNKMSFKARDFDGVKFDVSIHFYFKTLSLGFDVENLKYSKTEYKDVIGNNYMLGTEQFIFHHWYGTRWFNKDGDRVHNKIDNLEYEKFIDSKINLIQQYEEA